MIPSSSPFLFVVSTSLSSFLLVFKLFFVNSSFFLHNDLFEITFVGENTFFSTIQFFLYNKIIFFCRTLGKYNISLFNSFHFAGAHFLKHFIILLGCRKLKFVIKHIYKFKLVVFSHVTQLVLNFL